MKMLMIPREQSSSDQYNRLIAFRKDTPCAVVAPNGYYTLHKTDEAAIKAFDKAEPGAIILGEDGYRYSVEGPDLVQTDDFLAYEID